MSTLAMLLAVWLGGDLLHHLWIAARRVRWERVEPRGPGGLRPSAAPFDVGEGAVAVLCVHGFADTPAVFRPLAGRLAAGGGLHCRALRLPGAGAPTAAAAAVTADDWVDAVAAAARDLRRTHRQVWLAGHSLGGAIVLAAALRHPGLADGLCLLAPLLRVSRARSPLLPPRAWFGLARATFLFSRTFESCFSTDVALADDPASAYRRDRFIPFATYRNLFALTRELAPRAGGVRLPLFAALSAVDRVVDTPFTLRWLEACRPPRRELLLLPDTPHEIPTGPRWKEVTAAMRSFILNA